MRAYVLQPVAPNLTDVRCICGHHQNTHLFDCERLESICSVAGCPCIDFIRWEVFLLEGGDVYVVHDIEKFVRQDFPSLFSPEDLVVNHRPGSKRWHTWTRAENGLQKLAEEAFPSWKGWTLLTRAKTFRPTTI